MTATPDPSIAQEAMDIVAGVRRAAYGSALDSFTRTGRMWGAILHLDRDVTPEEVALCFIAHKMSRETHNAKRDNRVDMVGYSILLDEIAEEHDDA